MPAEEDGGDDRDHGGRSDQPGGDDADRSDGSASDRSAGDGPADDGPAGDVVGESDSPTDGSGSGPREPCPNCDEALPARARFCPQCSTAIDEDGGAVDLSELDADLLPDDPAELLADDDGGNRRATGSIRVVAGLAVSVPLAPLVLFLTSAVVSLSQWTAGLVFLAGWLLPAALLTRARVPAEAFGWSLYLVGVCTLLVPVAVRSGGFASGSDAAVLSFDVVALASFVIAGAAVALGAFVTRQAKERVSGERRGFEEVRED